MTIDEAIRIIKIVLVVAEEFEITVQGEEFTKEKCKEAVEIVTNALDQEPCEDAISRQAVLEIIRKCHCEEWVKADIGAPIEALQSVTSTEKVGQWIPLNDRLCLPENDGEYLVTVRGTTNRYYIILCSFALNLYEVDKDDFDNRRGIAGFYEYDSEDGYYKELNVVAWMPLPLPYKASPTGAEGSDKE